MLVIYGHPRCGYCVKAKALAETHKMEYVWKNTDEADVLSELKTRFPNAKTVPQIWRDDRYVGGYDQLAAEISRTVDE